MGRYTSLQPATDNVDGARCTFCSQFIMPVKWRARSAENVLAEWQHPVRDRGAQEIGVLDDSANIHTKRLAEWCDLLIEDWEDYVFFEQKARYEIGEMTAELVEDMYRRLKRKGWSKNCCTPFMIVTVVTPPSPRSRGRITSSSNGPETTARNASLGTGCIVAWVLLWPSIPIQLVICAKHARSWG